MAMNRPRLSVPEQNRRRAELDEIRLQRRLTPAEMEEDERLSHAFYMRQWRAEQASIEARLSGSPA